MGTQVSAAEAVKLFKNVTVQTAERITVKDKDTGKSKQALKVELKPLAPEHVLAAVRNGGGVVTLVTIDGQKLTAASRAGAEA